MKIIGREKEAAILDQIYASEKPEFLALYGRRRVGKTFLVKQFFNAKKGVFFSISGTKDAALAEQLAHFMGQVSQVFYHGTKLATVRNWDEAFAELTTALKSAPARSKIVLFFDELPWMATPKSKLLQSLDYYWNQHWSDNKKIKLIICGSSASWIINKVLKNRGGLHNRVTEKIHLTPLKLAETKKFLSASGVKLNDTQLALLYMVIGGVPFYLSKIPKNLSATQIIEKLAFSKNSFLLEEFDNLFASLFDVEDPFYMQAIRFIAGRREGIGKRELLIQIGTAAMGGAGFKKLQELEDVGFIKSFKPSFHQKKGIYYRVIDEYLLFYLKWIDPLRQTLEEDALESGHWEMIQGTPEWYNWLGYAFEALCYKHIAEIRKALHISPTSIANSWRYMPSKKSKNQGAQIDLLFDRKDDAITICEIKYTKEPFILTKEYAQVLERKIRIFKERTRTKKQIFLAMIAANGLKKNTYVDGFISGVATLKDLN